MTYQKALWDHGLLMHIQSNLSTMGTRKVAVVVVR